MAKDLPEGAPVMLRMSVERENGYLSFLGVEMDEISYGSAQLSIPFDEQFTDKDDDPPTVHNGIAATLMDQTAELAIRTTMPDPVNDRVEPLNLNINYLNDAVHDLVAVGEIVENNDGSAVASITVESKTPDGTKTDVAAGQAVYRTD